MKNKDLIDEDGEVIPAPVKNDIQALHDFTNDLNFWMQLKKLKVQHDGTVVFNFGKYAVNLSWMYFERKTLQSVDHG
ncbi:MAG: hypothetical protein R2778_05410 [Saprospiraceae bacterium]